MRLNRNALAALAGGAALLAGGGTAVAAQGDDYSHGISLPVCARHPGAAGSGAASD